MMEMISNLNILYTDFTLLHKSLDIYVSGCSGNPHCVDCQNPESWEFNRGEKYSLDYNYYIKNRIQDFDTLIDNIMIFGGEPLDQDLDELLHMLFELKQFGKKLWLFTRYELKEVPREVLLLCDYIKCGRYIPELRVESNVQFGINLATSNQKIYEMRNTRI